MPTLPAKGDPPCSPRGQLAGMAMLRPWEVAIPPGAPARRDMTAADGADEAWTSRWRPITMEN